MQKKEKEFIITIFNILKIILIKSHSGIKAFDRITRGVIRELGYK